MELKCKLIILGCGMQNISLQVHGYFINQYHTSVMRFGKSESSNVTYEDLLKLKEKKEAFLIDVREPEEILETGKLPGSTHIPCKQIWTNSTGPTNPIIKLYCLDGFEARMYDNFSEQDLQFMATGSLLTVRLFFVCQFSVQRPTNFQNHFLNLLRLYTL